MTSPPPTPTVTRALVRRGTRLAPVTAAADASLLDVLRRDLGQRHVPRGCKNGLCGSCRVLLDGVLVNSCVVTWGDVRDGASLEIFDDVEHEPVALQAVEAFTEARATRCRLCVPALGLTAVDLARRGKSGDAEAITGALETAACLCTGRTSMRRVLLSIVSADDES